MADDVIKRLLIKLTNLPDRFFNEEGEVDLSKVTGRDAVQYLAAVGIHLPISGGVSRS